MSGLMRRSLLVATGLIALLLGLVAGFPARLALGWFAPPELRAWGVDGTVWRGRAAEVVLEGRSLGALSWQAHPSRLLVLQPSWSFELRRPDGYVRARVGASLLANRQSIENLEASLSLATLPPAIVPNGVAGQLRATVQTLELADGWPSRIVGRAAVNELDLPGVILTLGPFEFRFADQPGPPSGEIRSLGGPLAVDGRIDLPAPRQWRFRAELAPGESPPRELIDGLAFVGEDLGGGRRLLELSSHE